MTYRLIIDGKLPCLNDYISECNRNKLCGAKLKKQTEMLIAVFIRKQLRGVKIEKPTTVDFSWHEPNKRRDWDNVSFAKKFILDALVSCKVLKNDNQVHVTGFTDSFFVDADNPRIEVVLREAGADDGN